MSGCGATIWRAPCRIAWRGAAWGDTCWLRRSSFVWTRNSRRGSTRWKRRTPSGSRSICCATLTGIMYGPSQASRPDMLFPAVDLEGAPLWGFTYRLLCDWLGLSAPDDPGPAILRFLLERGLALERDWHEGVAEVRGEIPVKEVLARFCSGPHVRAINRLEVRPDSVKLLGPGFEERIIRTAG